MLLLNLHANSSFPWHLKPFGCCMYTLSLRVPFRKAVVTSTWWRDKLCFTDKAIRRQRDSCCITGQKVLSKSVPYCCVKPLATSLALYLCTDPLLQLSPYRRIYSRLSSCLEITSPSPTHCFPSRMSSLFTKQTPIFSCSIFLVGSYFFIHMISLYYYQFWSTMLLKSLPCFNV